MVGPLDALPPGGGTTAVIVGGAAALASAMFTWMGSRRRYAGSVRTTDAERLWRENADLRAVLVSRIAILESRNEILESSIDGMKLEMGALRLENREKDGRIHHLERERVVDRTTISTLQHEINNLQAAFAAREVLGGAL